MATCPGKRDNHNCNAMLYKCRGCGNVGCILKGCSNIGFIRSGSKCVKCGKLAAKDTFRG